MTKQKRFYQKVFVKFNSGLGTIFLDECELKTPAGNQLSLPYRRLLKKISYEWKKQNEFINPLAMPFSQLSFTAIDRVAPNKKEIITDILKWGTNDLICYRAEAPEELLAEQRKKWDPYINWISLEYNIDLLCTTNISHIIQPTDSIKNFITILKRYDEFNLVGLYELVKIYGSLVIALRAITRNVDFFIAYNDSQVDENWQQRTWGEDPELVKKEKYLKKEIVNLNNYFNLLSF